LHDWETDIESFLMDTIGMDSKSFLSFENFLKSRNKLENQYIRWVNRNNFLLESGLLPGTGGISFIDGLIYAVNRGNWTDAQYVKFMRFLESLPEKARSARGGSIEEEAIIDIAGSIRVW
jgi:hypothetical protein